MVRLEAFAENAMSETVGAVEAVKAQISRLFPKVRWESGPAAPAVSMSAWFGLQGPAEFQLSVEPDGQVRMITMSHCERSEVELVANELELLAFWMSSLLSSRAFGMMVMANHAFNRPRRYGPSTCQSPVAAGRLTWSR